VRIAATNSLYFKKKPVNDIIINILAMKYGGGEKNPSKNKYLLPLLVGKGKRLEITTNLSMIKLRGEKNYPSLVGMCTYMNPRKVNPKSATVPVTSNLVAYAWSTKCRRKKKLITQFSCKSQDKSFEPN
jgi:hypothetical protein